MVWSVLSEDVTVPLTVTVCVVVPEFMVIVPEGVPTEAEAFMRTYTVMSIISQVGDNVKELV